MWQTKYATAVPKNLGVEVDFRPCSEGNILTGRPQSVPFSKLIFFLNQLDNAICKHLFSQILCTYNPSPVQFVRRKSRVVCALDCSSISFMMDVFYLFDVQGFCLSEDNPAGTHTKKITFGLNHQKSYWVQLFPSVLDYMRKVWNRRHHLCISLTINSSAPHTAMVYNVSYSKPSLN